MAARVIQTVPACGRDVQVKELTVSEIRQWLADLSAPKAEAEADVVDQLLFEGAAISEIGRMSDLTTAELASARPSELEAILARCREVNSHFFALRARLQTLGVAAMASMPPSASAA
ncbi:MAG: hypothetical protein H3C26_07305 [Rhodocyclaceae bacterium]|nr:hypothetical protein [Rhodocyclaceae bacterium]